MNDYFNGELARKRVLIAAHRGVAGGSIIENTVKGFIAAVNQGADIVEMDVVKTRDDKLVCIHDGMERRLFYLDWRYTPAREKTVMRGTTTPALFPCPSTSTGLTMCLRR